MGTENFNGLVQIPSTTPKTRQWPSFGGDSSMNKWIMILDLFWTIDFHWNGSTIWFYYRFFISILYLVALAKWLSGDSKALVKE